MKAKNITQSEVLKGIRKKSAPPTKVIESKKSKAKNKRLSDKEVYRDIYHSLMDLC